ncbi:hypothetical protein ABEF94_009135 [Exophiala dermatitidis]
MTSRLKMHTGHLLSHNRNPSQTTSTLTSHDNLDHSVQNNSSQNKTLLRGAASLIIWGGVDNKTSPTVDEEALNAWWTNEHLPERLAIPGFLRTRRYYTQSHSHSHSQSQSQSSSSSHYLVWYEVSSLSTLTSPAYMSALDNPTTNTRHFMPLLASMNRSACRLVYSTTRPELLVNTGAGSTLAHIVFQPPSSSQTHRQKLRSWIVDAAWSATLAPFPTALALHFFEHDEHATGAGSSTRSYEAVRFQEDSRASRRTEDNTATTPPNSTSTSTSGGRWMLLVEFAEPLGAPFGKAQVITDSIKQHIEALHADNVQARLYGLICALAV